MQVARLVHPILNASGQATHIRPGDSVPGSVTDPCSYVGQGFSPVVTAALKGVLEP
jgi:hypothetical protein